jgi:hypothetical protein
MDWISSFITQLYNSVRIAALSLVPIIKTAKNNDGSLGERPEERYA